MRSDVVVLLRQGGGLPVFMFAGSGGDIRELELLARHMAGDRPVLGVEALADIDGWPPEAIDAVVRRTMDVIRQRQPQGPYDLIGYSLGALVALETARQLQASGAVMGFVGLIDPIFERRFWPTRLFLASQAKRVAAHMAGLSRRRLTEVAPEVVGRARRLLSRLAHWAIPAQAVQSAAGEVDVYTRVFESYRPRAYGGPIHLFHSEFETEFGCDPVVLWASFVGPLRAWPVPGDHRSILRDPASVTLLARYVSDALAETSRTTAVA
jgi:phthiocerol/phenolphthiocerol synthesis type-I polyketide synthase D